MLIMARAQGGGGGHYFWLSAWPYIFEVDEGKYVKNGIFIGLGLRTQGTSTCEGLYAS